MKTLATLLFFALQLAPQLQSSAFAQSCGDGYCEGTESCEWNGAENRQMLCDGYASPIPSDQRCDNCQLNYLDQGTCGDGYCSAGEDCEWYGAENRQMLCDGYQSPVPAGSQCHSCKIYNSSQVEERLLSSLGIVIQGAHVASAR